MKFEYVDILESIKEKYSSEVNDKLISLRLVQSKVGCFLHSEYEDEPDVVYIENMDVIADDDLIELSEIINPSMFNVTFPIEKNVEMFLENIDAYTIGMCFEKIVLYDFKK